MKYTIRVTRNVQCEITDTVDIEASCEEEAIDIAEEQAWDGKEICQLDEASAHIYNEDVYCELIGGA